jgi:hypothetical protein
MSEHVDPIRQLLNSSGLIECDTIGHLAAGDKVSIAYVDFGLGSSWTKTHTYARGSRSDVDGMA